MGDRMFIIKFVMSRIVEDLPLINIFPLLLQDHLVIHHSTILLLKFVVDILLLKFELLLRPEQAIMALKVLGLTYTSFDCLVILFS